MGAPLNILLPDRDPQPEISGLFGSRQESSTLDVLKAQVELPFIDIDTRLVFRAAKRFFSGDADDITDHRELNKMFPELDIPFNKPLSLEVAQEMSDIDVQRKGLQRIIQNGDPDSYLQQASGLALGIGVNILDPVGMALGMGIGRGLMAVMGKVVMRGGKAAKFLKPASRGLGGRVFEGAAGNAIQEMVVGRTLLKQEKVDVDTYNNLTFAIGAGILFPLGGAAFKFLRSGKNAIAKTNKVAALAESQMENGKRVHTEPYIRAELAKELQELEDNLTNMKRTREEALAAEAGIEGDKTFIRSVEEIDQDILELQEMVELARESAKAPLDRAEEARKANSPEEDIYFDKEAEDLLVSGEREPFIAERSKEFEDSFKEINDQIDELEASGESNTFVKKSLDEAKAVRDNADNFDRMARMATDCVRRG